MTVLPNEAMWEKVGPQLRIGIMSPGVQEEIWSGGFGKLCLIWFDCITPGPSKVEKIAATVSRPVFAFRDCDSNCEKRALCWHGWKGTADDSWGARLCCIACYGLAKMLCLQKTNFGFRSTLLRSVMVCHGHIFFLLLGVESTHSHDSLMRSLCPNLENE